MVKKTNHCTCREKEHIIKQVQKKTLGFIENKFNMLNGKIQLTKI